MIIDNDPPITRHISVPRDMSQLSCSSFTAGVVEAVLDGLGFVRFSPCHCARDRIADEAPNPTRLLVSLTVHACGRRLPPPLLLIPVLHACTT